MQNTEIAFIWSLVAKDNKTHEQEIQPRYTGNGKREYKIEG